MFERISNGIFVLTIEVAGRKLHKVCWLVRIAQQKIVLIFFFLETNWHKEKSQRRPEVQNCAPYRMPPTHAARKKKRQSFNLCSTLNIYNLQQKQAWYWFGAATKIVHFLERSFDRALLFPCLTRKKKKKNIPKPEHAG